MSYCKFLDDDQIVKHRTEIDDDLVTFLENLSECMYLLFNLQNQLDELLRHPIFNQPVIDSIEWDHNYQLEQNSYILTINAHDPNNLILNYSVSCNDPNVTISNDTSHSNRFFITYPNYASDISIDFTIVVSNDNNYHTTQVESVMVHKYLNPVIDSITWNETTQLEKHQYIMTINAHDPQNLALSYHITPSDPDIIIERSSSEPNVFRVTYPNYFSDVSITFLVEVVNDKGLKDRYPETVLVFSYRPPVITRIEWNDYTHYEQHEYIMTIIASDPYDLPLSYQVECNDPNVSIVQDTTNPNVFHVTYPDYESDTVVSFNIKVTNDDNQQTTESIYVTAKIAPSSVISDVYWDDNYHYEQRSYTLTIIATDPQNLDMTYELLSDSTVIQSIVPVENNPNQFTVTYKPLDSNITVQFVAKVTNELGSETSRNVSVLVHAYEPPNIQNVQWEQTDHSSNGTNTLDVTAVDPQGLDLTYTLTCNNSLVDITDVGGDPYKFNVSYQTFSSNTNITYTLTVTNEDNLSSTKTINVTVRSYVVPRINRIEWTPTGPHYEQKNYNMTIYAIDDNGLDIVRYEVESSDTNVGVEQIGGLSSNTFKITYPSYSNDTTVTFTVKAINAADLEGQKDFSVVVKAYVPPVIDGISWDSTSQYENNDYTMTINAHDDNQLDLTYSVTFSPSNVPVTIAQDPYAKNVFKITYGDLSDSTNITYNITVTNSDGLSATTTNTVMVNTYTAPNILRLNWETSQLYENNGYKTEIVAEDPQGLDTRESMSYNLTCTDPRVTISKMNTVSGHSGDPEYDFYVEFNTLGSTVTFTFTAEVTNTRGQSSSKNFTATVIGAGSPYNIALSWDTTDQYEQHTYHATASAENPQPSTLYYKLTCDKSEVNITPNDYSTNNQFTVTYPDYSSDQTVNFTLMVKNSEGKTGSTVDTRTVKVSGAPSVDANWGNVDIIYENNTYTLYITATDPNNVPINSYTAACSDSRVTISNGSAPNEKNVEFSEFTDDTDVTITVTATNNNGETGSKDIVVNVKKISSTPSIDSITWSDDPLKENTTYTATINAHVSGGATITNYTLTTSHSGVTINDISGHPEKKSVGFGNFGVDTDVTFTATVTTNENKTDTLDVTVTVHKQISAPIITDITFNDSPLYEQTSYTATVHATGDGTLHYQLECTNDSSVSITQSNPSSPDFTVTFPNYSSSKSLTFKATVQDIDHNLSSDFSKSFNISVFGVPSITNVTWDKDEHYETLTRVLTITATDEANRSLGYSVTVSPNNLGIGITQKPLLKNKFTITYPELTNDVNVTFTAKVYVTTEPSVYSTYDIPITIKAFDPPTIIGTEWQDGSPRGWMTNTLVVTASQSGPISITNYQLECISNCSGIIISQNQTYPNIFFVSFPGYESDISVGFKVTVSNEKNLSTDLSWTETVGVAIGDTGVFAGGFTANNPIPVNVIQSISITTGGNTSDFGDLTIKRGGVSSTSDGIHNNAIFTSYTTNSVPMSIEILLLGTPGNGSYFGYPNGPLGECASVSNGTDERGVLVGGCEIDSSFSGGTTDKMSYVTINSPGNGSYFGDLYLSGNLAGTGYVSNATNGKGIIAGGYYYQPPLNPNDYEQYSIFDNIRAITINTPGEGTMFGKLQQLVRNFVGVSNGIHNRGIFYVNNKFEYINIGATGGDATEFGSLLNGPFGKASCSNGIGERGIFAGGCNYDPNFHHPLYNGLYDFTPTNPIETIYYLTINTSSNASNFGNLLFSNAGLGGTSNA